ncbi:MAG: RNA polymerase sigma factor, partial [Ktedonobacterales bacterium]
MGKRISPDAGETAWFAELLARTQTALYQFARGLTGEPELARDLTQDAFVAAWRALRAGTPPFDGTGATTEAGDTAVRRWLFTVTYRHALKARRRRQRIAWEPLDADGLYESAAGAASSSFEDRVADAEALRAALLTLDPQDAACFLLQAVYGFATTEIAAIVGAQPDATRKRLSR